MAKFGLLHLKIYGKIFAFFMPTQQRPSVQVLEIIRHGYASFYRKNYRWDYQKKINGLAPSFLLTQDPCAGLSLLSVPDPPLFNLLF